MLERELVRLTAVVSICGWASVLTERWLVCWTAPLRETWCLGRRLFCPWQTGKEPLLPHPRGRAKGISLSLEYLNYS